MVKTTQKKFRPFDPEPSLRLALDLFQEADVTAFALIGKLAMWAYIEDESQHQFTKDVDFAVLLKDIGKLEEVVRRHGLHYEHLRIGGLGIREASQNIDFIDRRLYQADRLFAEAIAAAETSMLVQEQPIPIVPLEYLVAMKMASGEAKDDEDVQHLLALPLEYEKARVLVEKYLGPFTADRLDVFARQKGVLPQRGPYQER